ncbi:hypothetical protein V6N13_114906 [Hibiscus sabdariffa]|uniref:Uncharacterized protein n=1 Tax=Hibiscus sabdariffa TaxID=183260 RepID=A0ABR2U395_9ROSI
MAGKHAPIATKLPSKKQPNVKKRAVGEAHPEKSTTDLVEMERKKREAENSSTKRTCSKGCQTKYYLRKEEGGKEKRRPK